MKAVKAHQAIHRSNPEETIGSLCERRDEVLRQPLLGRPGREHLIAQQIRSYERGSLERNKDKDKKERIASTSQTLSDRPYDFDGSAHT
jgi:hypothetical protein